MIARCPRSDRMRVRITGWPTDVNGNFRSTLRPGGSLQLRRLQCSKAFAVCLHKRGSHFRPSRFGGDDAPASTRRCRSGVSRSMAATCSSRIWIRRCAPCTFRKPIAVSEGNSRRADRLLLADGRYSQSFQIGVPIGIRDRIEATGFGFRLAVPRQDVFDEFAAQRIERYIGLLVRVYVEIAGERIMPAGFR